MIKLFARIKPLDQDYVRLLSDTEYWRLSPQHHTGMFSLAKVKRRPLLDEEEGTDWLRNGKPCLCIHEEAGMSFTFITDR